MRRPPVSSRNRSSRRAAISSGLIDTTRTAASSIASGMPSSRRQIVVDGRRVRASSAKPGARRARTVDEQLHRVARRRPRRARRELGDAQRAQRASAARRRRRGASRLVAEDAHTRAARAARGRRAARPGRGGARSCRASRGAPCSGGTRRCCPRASMPRCGAHARARRDRLRASTLRRSPRASSQNQAPSAKSPTSSAAHLQREAGLADAADARDRHEPGARRARSRTRCSSSSRPTNDVSCDRQVRRATRRASAAAGTRRRPGTASWKTCSGRARSRRRCSPRSSSLDAGRRRGPASAVACEMQHLAAVRRWP